jgi:hypothetical protein
MIKGEPGMQSRFWRGAGGAPWPVRDRKAYVPEPLTVDASGAISSTGRHVWFILPASSLLPGLVLGRAPP